MMSPSLIARRTLAALFIASLTACGGRATLPGPTLPLSRTPEQSFREHPPEPAPRAIPRLPEPVVFALRNGLTVALVPREHPTVVAAFVARRGGDNDMSVAPGIADLTARLVGRGSLRHPGNTLIDAMTEEGIDFGSTALRDGSVVMVRSAANTVSQAISYLAETVREPSFEANYFDRMRNEQLEEREHDVLSERTVPRLLALSLLYPNHVSSRPFTGTVPEIRMRTRMQIAAFHHDRYVPNDGVLLLVGGVTRAQVEPALDRAFGDWPAAPPIPVRITGTRSTQRTGRIHVVNLSGAQQTQVVLAFDTVPAGHPDGPALEVLAEIVGGLFSSRLNMAIREERGDTYGVHATLERHDDVGTLLVRARVEMANTSAALYRMLHEMDRLRAESVTPAELAAARTQLRESVFQRLETNEGTMDLYAGAVLDGRPWTLARDLLAGYDAVTADDVLRVARTYLDPTREEVVLVGDAQSVAVQCQLGGFGDVVQYSFQQ